MTASIVTTKINPPHPVLKLRSGDKLRKLITSLNGWVPQHVLLTLQNAMAKGDQKTLLLTLCYIRECLRPQIVKEGKSSPLFDIGLGIELCLEENLPSRIDKPTFLEWYTTQRLYQQMHIAKMEIEAAEAQAFYEEFDKLSLKALESMAEAAETTQKIQRIYVEKRKTEAARIEARQIEMERSIREFQQRLSGVSMDSFSLPSWLKETS